MSPCLRSSNRKCVRLSEAESYQLNMYSNVKKPIQFNLDLYCLSVTRRESMAWESSKCIFVSELVCSSSSLSLCLFVSFFLSFIYLSRSIRFHLVSSSDAKRRKFKCVRDSDKIRFNMRAWEIRRYEKAWARAIFSHCVFNRLVRLIN